MFMSALSSTVSHATEAEIACILSPQTFVGNVLLIINPNNSTFQIGYEDFRRFGSLTVTVNGTSHSQGKDSMGFDQFDLCTGQPCTGPTYLGFLKAANRAKNSDRVSYLHLSENSNTPIKVIKMGQEVELKGLLEFKCTPNPEAP